MTIKFKNKERFYAKLRATVPKIKDNLTDANRKSATEMVVMAKSLVPVADEMGGTLRDSIRMSPGRRESSFVVEAGGPTTTKVVQEGADGSYDYALAQEFGTVEVTAQPYFWPSYRVTKKRHKGRASRALNKAIKEAGF